MTVLSNLQLGVVLGVGCPACLMVAAFALKRWHSWSRDRRVRARALARERARGQRVIVFSRYPQSGRSKTRLIPLLGEDGAAHAQLLMTNHLLKQLQSLQERTVNLSIELRHSSGSAADIHHWLVPFSPSPHKSEIFWREQCPGELGERMAEAFETAFKEGAQYVVLVGSDIPAINEDIVSNAFTMLGSAEFSTSEKSAKHPLLFAPAADGGYYLVAASKEILPHLDQLFKGISWGTSQVLEEQLAAANRLHLQVGVLPQQLSDVDVPSDFAEFERVINVQASQLVTPTWSIVIPVLNEGQNIRDCLMHTVKQVAHPERIEFVVCDGGSTDSTLAQLDHLLKEDHWLRGAKLIVCHSSRGRAKQQNTAVRSFCSHDYLIFLHADTRLPVDFDKQALSCIRKPGNVAGAFPFSLDVLHPDGPPSSSLFRYQMGLICNGVARRVCHHELPYGDQAIFLSRRTFNDMGGYADIPLMEDYELVQRLHKLGHVQVAEGPPAITSSRRWRKHGVFRVTGLNQLIIIAYRLGVSPQTLARWYYGKPKQD